MTMTTNVNEDDNECEQTTASMNGQWPPHAVQRGSLQQTKTRMAGLSSSSKRCVPPLTGSRLPKI
jgi:hypothetical protein